jgi:hypothetical protein
MCGGVGLMIELVNATGRACLKLAQFLIQLHFQSTHWYCLILPRTSC